ncbi:hypothetical protein GCM10010389_53050 [Streptomyces echinoruber]|uniref:Uncharacterized protein n=1 Tax=Streptomyces echinoruber TaxID=68898 RepID=A0A918VJQ6_9ACTN|nr:hypothetical protein GCM10010389_53050 [Streptomyces echinoruber]
MQHDVRHPALGAVAQERAVHERHPEPAAAQNRQPHACTFPAPRTATPAPPKQARTAASGGVFVTVTSGPIRIRSYLFGFVRVRSGPSGRGPSPGRAGDLAGPAIGTTLSPAPAAAVPARHSDRRRVRHPAAGRSRGRRVIPWEAGGDRRAGPDGPARRLFPAGPGNHVGPES